MTDALSQFSAALAARRAEIAELSAKLGAEAAELEAAERVFQRLCKNSALDPEPALKWPPRTDVVNGVVEELPEPTPTREEAQGEHVDAGKLRPLTEKQCTVFKALVENAAKSNRGFAYSSEIRRACPEFSNVDDALHALYQKGYTKRRHGADGVVYYTPHIVVGAIKIEDSVNKVWSDGEQRDLVRALVGAEIERHEPNWGKLAMRFARSAQAVEQKARTAFGWPKTHGAFVDQIRHEMAQEEAPASVRPTNNQPKAMVPVKTMPVPADLEDLTKNAREVLCIVFELNRDNIKAREPDILAVSEVSPDRLPFVLTRLSQLLLLQRGPVGEWTCTPRGTELAEAIKESEGA
jgi:hypothetical protein